MSYTAPPVFSVSQVVTASNLNTLGDDIVWLATDKPMCRVYNNASITVATSTLVALTYNSERFDNASMHSTSSNTGRITIPTGGGGKYLVGGCAIQNAAGFMFNYIYVNGTTDIAESSGYDASFQARSNIATIYSMSAADYFTYHVFESNATVYYNANSSPEFWAVWIGT